VTKIATK